MNNASGIAPRKNRMARALPRLLAVIAIIRIT